MSTTGTTINPCPVIQSALVQWFNTCPSSRRLQTPTLVWANSPQNKSGINQIIQPTSGKKRTVELVFTQPAPASDLSAVESCDKVCDATTERGDEVVQYTIACTDGVSINRKIRVTDWNESCKSDGAIIMEVMQGMLDTLMAGVGGDTNSVAEKQATELNPLLGNWSSDVDPSWLTVDEFLEVATKDSNGKVDFQWLERLNLAKAMTNYCGNTLITGGSDLYSAWRLVNAGCCTNDGLDALSLVNQFGEAVVYDRFVAAEFGNDVSLLLQSNSIQLLNVTWNTPLLGLGSMVDLDLTYRNGFQTVIQDPVTGIFVDLNIKEDCGVVHIVMTATTKTVGLPNNLYPAGHPLEFVTFANGIQVVNP